METAKLDLDDPKQAHLAERLKNDVIVWISTVRPDGRPHSVPVWFLWDGSTVLIFSKPDQKIRNLAQNKNVVLALDNTQGGSDVGLIEGEAVVSPNGEVSTAMPPAYYQKYGEQIASFGWTGESMAAEYSQTIRVTPTRFRHW